MTALDELIKAQIAKVQALTIEVKKETAILREFIRIKEEISIDTEKKKG